jgi:hypothetical protein
MLRYTVVVASAVAIGSAGAQATWTLSAQPLVSIGGEGTPATEFSRVEGIMRLSGGRVAVVNGATSEIRIFGPGGELLKTFGRKGEGPGEFRGLTSVGRSGDTAFFYDYNLKRITIAHLGAEPRVVKTVTYAPVSSRGYSSVDGRLSDGRWTVATWVSPTFDGPPGTHRLNTSVGIVQADGTGVINWVAESPSFAVFVHSPTGNIKEASVGIAGFSPGFTHIANGSLIVYGDQATDSLTIQAGEKRTDVRIPLPKRAITKAMADAARDRELAAMPSTAREKSKGWTTARYDLKNTLKDLPTFSKLLAGVDGETWIEEYTPTPQEPTRYLVIGPTGASRAWVSVPAGLRLKEVGRDYVAGVQFDADDVETVRVYSLNRR